MVLKQDKNAVFSNNVRCCFFVRYIIRDIVVAYGFGMVVFTIA